MQAFEPRWHLTLSAVRGNLVFILGIQAAVRLLQADSGLLALASGNVLRLGVVLIAKMDDPVCFSKQDSDILRNESNLLMTEYHGSDMLVGIKTLHIAFSVMLPADFEYFVLVEQILLQTILRQLKGWVPSEETSPVFHAV